MTALIALLYAQIFPAEGWSDLWRIASVSATIAGLVIVILGQTAAFAAISRLPIIRGIVPPIDGDWIGEFTSNFPKIAEAFRLKADDLDQPITACFKIRARLFNVTISTVSLSPRPGYMRSDTTAFRISRCSMTQRDVIHYVYDAVVRDPKESDVDRFNGAARLTVLREGTDITLDGAYWTDRNWQRGQNTAGTLSLRRAKA
jgi:hypothetical protein